MKNIPGSGNSPAHRANFLHLYMDIGWFGLLSGSAMAFLSIYLVRIGASALQIGMINAAPSLTAIGLALPAGRWLGDRPVDRAVFNASILHRIFYLIWIPLPVLIFDSVEVTIVIVATFLMSAYPGLMAFTTDVPLFLFTSIIGGISWSLAGGALSNYLLEQIPTDDRASHLAWYMLVTNLAVLGGSLLGPALARGFGLVPALAVIAVGRVLSGVGIWRMGRNPGCI